ncbi:MAG: glycosyltransferase [Candidatus Omnitrophica bacterium]|nr:glycosyltransferase [Candidatus Omnitrophota bacterium]
MNEGSFSLAQNAVIDCSVIIATRNRSKEICEVLSFLRDQITEGKFFYEVIIVDNNSDDDTNRKVKALINDYPVSLEYLYESRIGKGYALNLGIEKSRGKYIALTDDDVLIPKDWLSHIYRTFEETAADGVGGPIEAEWIGERPKWLGASLIRQLAIVNHGDELFASNTLETPFVGPNMAYKRELFMKYGGFELNHKNQDYEIYRFFLSCGCKLIYQPRMKVRHKIRSSSLSKKYFAKRFFHHGMRTDAGYEERCKSSKSVLGIPIWMMRFFVQLHFEALKSFLKGSKDDALWHWLRRYYYLGAMWDRLRKRISKAEFVRTKLNMRKISEP